MASLILMKLFTLLVILDLGHCSITEFDCGVQVEGWAEGGETREREAGGLSLVGFTFSE